MRQAICFLYSPIRLLIVIIVSPILTILYCGVFTPILIQLHLFRKLLSLVARLMDPDLSKIVNAYGHITSRDFEEWSTKPSHFITTVFKFKGNVTLEESRQLILQKWVLKTLDENPSQLEYPELQQYCTKRLGYLFYKWDREFDISKHVKLYSDKLLLPNPETDVVNETKLMRIWESLIVAPISDKKSPWEFFLVPNYEPPKGTTQSSNDDHYSLGFLRMHHGVCDGASQYKCLLMLTDNGWGNTKTDIAAFQDAPKCMNFLLNLQAFFLGPTAMVNKFSKGFDYYNPLHIPVGKLTGKCHMAKTSFDVDTIKNITRVHLDVSFHSVLIAALTGGIRNFLLGNGHSIPLFPIRVGIPIPKPGHSIKLRNEYLVSVIELPVHKKSPKERLFACEKMLYGVKNDSFVPHMEQCWKLMGALPSEMVRFFTLKSAVSCVYSEIRGPTIPLTIQEGKYELMDLMYSFGLGTDNLGN